MRGSARIGCLLISIAFMITRLDHALLRTAAGHRGCNRRASWPPSLMKSLNLLELCQT